MWLCITMLLTAGTDLFFNHGFILSARPNKVRKSYRIIESLSILSWKQLTRIIVSNSPHPAGPSKIQTSFLRPLPKLCLNSSRLGSVARWNLLIKPSKTQPSKLLKIAASHTPFILCSAAKSGCKSTKKGQWCLGLVLCFQRLEMVRKDPPACGSRW